MRQMVICCFFLLLSLCLWAPSRVLAQSEEVNLESCFRYYDYGNIAIDLAPDQPSYASNDTLKLRGFIVNKNDVPLADTEIFVQVKRINSTSVSENGNYLIDQFTLADNLNLLPKETKSIEKTIRIKPSYPKGDYQLQYFVFHRGGFHYAGRPFLEEDYAGTSNFTIQSGPELTAYFDIDNLRVNGVNRPIRGITQELSPGTIQFQLPIVDTRKNKTPIPAIVKFYRFEDTIEENQVGEQRFTIEPADSALTLQFTPREQGAFVMVAEFSQPIQSILKYRFAVTADKASDLRMNDLGVTDFPATRTSRAWVCFHSPMTVFSPLTEVKLAVLNEKEMIVDQISITDSFSPDVQAISLPLSKLANGTDFYLEAQIITKTEPVHTRSVRVHYDCSKFDNSLKDFTVLQNEKDPAIVDITGTTICNKPVTGELIGHIRVFNDSSLVRELTNVGPLPYQFSLGDLPSSSYRIEVRIHDTTKNLTVNHSQSSSFSRGIAKKVSNPQGLLGSVIIASALGGFAFLFIQSQKKR